MDKITQPELKEVLSYSPKTGLFTWLVDRRSYKAGDIAGRSRIINGVCYQIITLKGYPYEAHRLAWLYMTGEWPNIIDHINGNGSDNQWANLRNVSRTDNQRNAKLHKNNKWGLPGIFFDSRYDRFNVRIGGIREGEHLTYTNDFFEACCARKSAENRLGYHSNHGRLDR